MKLLLGYHHRPITVGVMFRRAARQMGYDFRTIGPGENTVWHPPCADWRDYEPPDIVAADVGHEASALVRIARDAGFDADALVFIDQYDSMHVTGQSDGTFLFAHVAVENWEKMQYERSLLRRADAEFYMIFHDDMRRRPCPPLPMNAKWLPFGCDVLAHPNLRMQRDKWVCQIGTPYTPRPLVWDALRADLDGAGPVRPEEYGVAPAETAHTIFGRIPDFEGMAVAYNRSVCALSSSNVDFIPMRCPEAFAMGNVLISDDVLSMRQIFGAPWPENPDGIWTTHDRTRAGYVARIREMIAHPDIAQGIAERAYTAAINHHQYAHRLQTVLAAL